MFVQSGKTDDPIEQIRTQIVRRPWQMGWGIPIAVGLVSGMIAQIDRVTVQLFLHGGSFGVSDPEFGYDTGFFTFGLPLYRSVLNWLLSAAILAFLASLITHYLVGGLNVAKSTGR